MSALRGWKAQSARGPIEIDPVERDIIENQYFRRVESTAEVVKHGLRKALRNLDDEATFIAVDDETAVRLVVSRVLTAVAQLQEQPAMERPGRVPGTRELVVLNTRYIVPYRVQAGEIQILRVFHTSRRPPRVGKPPSTISRFR